MTLRLYVYGCKTDEQCDNRIEYIFHKKNFCSWLDTKFLLLEAENKLLGGYKGVTEGYFGLLKILQGKC